MEQIRPISHSPAPIFRFLSSPVQQTLDVEDTQTFNESISQQPIVAQHEIDIKNLLSQEQTQEVTDIFRSINILANQSLELEQGFANRELLQTQVEEDISELRSVLDQFRQDDLRLFVAVFQNQIPGGLTNTGSTNNNSASDLFLGDASSNSLENFLRIDVTSETGSLAALDLTGNIIDTLSGDNRGTDLLESLLNDLTGSFLVSAIQGDLEESQEIEESTTSSDNEPSQDVDTNEPIIPTLSPTPTGSDPPTIIDFAG